MDEQRKKEARRLLIDLRKTIKQSNKVVMAVKKEMKIIEHRARLNIMKLEGLL